MKQQKKGKIINISSGTTQTGTPFFLHYVSSKAGVFGFTRALAREVGGDNICVNSIMPGLTISSSNQEGVTSPEQLADRRKRRAIQRDQYPADLVGTVIFLASDDSDFMTGQVHRRRRRHEYALRRWRVKVKCGVRGRRGLVAISVSNLCLVP